MTRNELLAKVPIRCDPRSQRQVIAFTDIPAPWAAQWFIALAGHATPGVVDPHGPCAYAEDWTRWVKGELLPGPTDLADD